MAEPVSLTLPDAEATAGLGASVAEAIRANRPERLVIHLTGGLGAGKTSLARGLLTALGHGGRVPSPTYTLVEPYALNGYGLFHVDLYRLADPGELEYLGLRDQLGPGTILIAEWPERGQGWLPEPDLLISLDFADPGRHVRLEGRTTAGAELLERVARPGGRGRSGG